MLISMIVEKLFELVEIPNSVIQNIADTAATAAATSLLTQLHQVYRMQLLVLQTLHLHSRPLIKLIK